MKNNKPHILGSMIIGIGFTAIFGAGYFGAFYIPGMARVIVLLIWLTIGVGSLIGFQIHTIRKQEKTLQKLKEFEDQV
jgi:hypothetical protein